MRLKCNFFQKRLKHLGHIISNHTLSLDPDRVRAILDMPPPSNEKSLSTFMGMVQFCSNFVEGLSVLLAPMSENLKNTKVFQWSPACQRAFDDIKKRLSTAPVLYTPTKNDYFVLETDASNIGLGGCLKAFG